MKWRDARILLLTIDREWDGGPDQYHQPADYAVYDAAGKMLAGRYKVPMEHRRYHGPHARGFLQAGSTSLSGMTLESKLIVVAHGLPTSISGYTAERFARLLHSYGLRDVGLISFKSCYLGKQNFLDDLVRAASGLFRVGWCIGYLHQSYTRGRSQFSGREHWRGLFTPRFLHPLLKGPDAARVKVVQGNVAVVPPFGTSHRFVPGVRTMEP